MAAALAEGALGYVNEAASVHGPRARREAHTGSRFVSPLDSFERHTNEEGRLAKSVNVGPGHRRSYCFSIIDLSGVCSNITLNVYQHISTGTPLSALRNCVRTVSHTPRNPGRIASFTGTLRRTSLLREVVDRNCVGGIWCASARASGTNFQACSFNHSDISPFRVNDLRAVSDQIIPRRRRMHASSTSPLNPAVYGRRTARPCAKLCQTSKSFEVTYGR